MERLIHLIIKQNKIFALGFIVITILLALNLSKITVRNSVRDLLSGDKDTYTNYEQFLRDFGGNATLVITFDPSVSQEIFLEKTTKIIDEIDKTILINKLVAEVKINGKEKILVIDSLLQKWSNTSMLSDLRLSITTQNSNNFIKSNQKIAIQCPTIECENAYFQQLFNKLNEIIDQHAGYKGEIVIYGSTAFNEILKSTLTAEMLKLFLMAFLLISVFSIFFLSRISGALITLVFILFGVIWSFSFLGILGIPISGTLQLFPFFILVVGTCYIIHLLTIFYKEWENPNTDKTTALIQSYKTCSQAILGAALTTFLGLLSFCFIEVKVIAQLGFISSIGTLCMTLIVLLFLPAFISLLPLKKGNSFRMSRFFNKINVAITIWVKGLAVKSVKYYRVVLIVTLFIVGFSIANFRHLRFVYNPIDWLPNNLEVSELAKKKINVGEWNYILEMVINSGKEQGTFDEDFLQAFDSLYRALETQKEILEIRQISTVYDALPQRVPFNEAVLNLPEAKSNFFQSFVDETQQNIKLQLAVPWGDHNDITRVVDKIDSFTKKEITYPFYITGKPMMLAEMAKNLIGSLNTGYGFAFITVFMVMFLLLRNWTLNFLSLFPNLIPIIIILGLLGLFKVPLDVLLLLTSTIILSISVDDTLHLFLHMKEYMAKNTDERDSTGLFLFTHEHIGFSIVATSCLIALSFGIFIFSSFPIMRIVGLVIALGAILALLADIVLVPALYQFVISFRKKAEVKKL